MRSGLIDVGRSASVVAAILCAASAGACERQVCECAVHVGGTTPSSAAEQAQRSSEIDRCLAAHGGGTIRGCPMPPSMPPPPPSRLPSVDAGAETGGAQTGGSPVHAGRSGLELRAGEHALGLELVAFGRDHGAQPVTSALPGDDGDAIRYERGAGLVE